MDVMSVANVYTALQMSQFQNAVQTDLLKMAMDSQTQAAQNLIQSLSAGTINPPNLGNNIDLYL